MEALITITEQDNKQVVNARELHNFLEVDTKFTMWIERRINDYGFFENEDFEVFLKNGKNSKGGRPSKEYAISLDMAKELSMVERNEKGKQARRYFIECEKRAKSNNIYSLSSATKVLSLPIKPIAERKKEMQQELMEVIRLNLNRGDLKRLAMDLGISYNVIRNVISSKTFNYDVIYSLYEKARYNMEFLDTGIGVLTEDLKTLSA